MNIFIISFSFLVSLIVSNLILKHRKYNRWIALLSAFCTNTVILSLATWTFHLVNEEYRIFGIDFHHRNSLVLSIPIVTWINYWVLTFQKNARQ